MKSRLNPNKKSRSALKSLLKKGILYRYKVGLRHIIRTNGTVELVGFNIDLPIHHDLPNFAAPGWKAYSDVVQYCGERAELTATYTPQSWDEYVQAFGTRFEPNPLATDLLKTRRRPGSQPLIAFGDAVLVNDNRMHFCLCSSNNKRTVDDIEFIQDMLTSPRTVFRNAHQAMIFFHAEPSQNDIMTIMMTFC
jgi:hypothetical protein